MKKSPAAVSAAIGCTNLPVIANLQEACASLISCNQKYKNLLKNNAESKYGLVLVEGKIIAYESAKEVGMPQDKEGQDNAREEKEVIPEEARELLEYLFNYLYEDQSNMVEIKLYETAEELYYKWKIRYSSGEFSNPCVLEYSYTTSDGLYYEFATYAEVWEIYYDKEGIEHKEHTRDSYGDFLLVNTENLEVISRWIVNEDENTESDYIENEKYWEIIRSYAEGNEQ